MRAIRRFLNSSLARFAYASGLSFAISFGTPVLLVDGVGVHANIAVALGFLLTILINFMVMRHFVFASAGSALHEQLKRFLIQTFSFRTGEYLAFYCLLNFAALSYQTALLLVLLPSAALKFLVGRYWVFKRLQAP